MLDVFSPTGGAVDGEGKPQLASRGRSCGALNGWVRADEPFLPAGHGIPLLYLGQPPASTPG